MRRTLFAIPVLIILTACGGVARDRAIQTAHATLEAAHRGFMAYVEARGKRIVEEADSLEEGREALDALFESADRVHAAFRAAYLALAAAALREDDLTLENAIAAVDHLIEVYNTFTKAEVSP